MGRTRSSLSCVRRRAGTAKVGGAGDQRRLEGIGAAMTRMFADYARAHYSRALSAWGGAVTISRSAADRMLSKQVSRPASPGVLLVAVITGELSRPGHQRRPAGNVALPRTGPSRARPGACIRSSPWGCSVQVATGRSHPTSTALLRAPVPKCGPIDCDELAIPARLTPLDIRTHRAVFPNAEAAQHDKGTPVARRGRKATGAL